MRSASPTGGASAGGTALDRRASTSERISEAAQRLADEHGLDGFTMDDLAEAASVSRRTLFNYFPSKLDAVLGEHMDCELIVLETFRAGGPTGDLVEDLAALARGMLRGADTDRTRLLRKQRLLNANPRLLAVAHARFELMSAELVEEILTREGPTFEAARARVVVRLLVAVFDASLDLLLDDPSGEQQLADLFTANLRIARQLLG